MMNIQLNSYSKGNRFTSCPDFGETQYSTSIKFIYLCHRNNEIIRMTYKDTKETFLDILTKYKALIKYIESQQKELVIKNTQTNNFIGLHERLQFYKEQIEDPTNLYFLIMQRPLKKVYNNVPENIEKINEILKQKKYKEERFYDPADKFKFIVNMKNKEIQFEGYKQETVQELKCNICKTLKLNLKQFQIIFAGKPLNNDYISLEKASISEGSLLFLAMKALGGCFSSDALIKVGDKRQVNIIMLKKGDMVLSYNQRQRHTQEDYITSIHKTQIRFYVSITLSNKVSIRCSPTHRFYTQDGWKNYQYSLNQARLQIGDQLMTQKLQPISITNLQLIELDQPQQFYHISTLKNHTFIINGFITHNMQIRVISNQDGVEYLINTNEQDTILQIKKKISQLYNVPFKEQILLLGSKELRDGESISDYAIDFKNSSLRLLIKSQKMIVVHHTNLKKQYSFNISNQNKVSQLKDMIHASLQIPPKQQILFVNNIELSHHEKLSKYPLKQNYNRINLVIVQNNQVTQSVARFMQMKYLTIKVKNNQSISVNYFIFKEMTVQQFISAVIPNSRPSFSLIFGQLLLNPSDRLYAIQNYSLFGHQNMECQIVTNYDRLMFFNIVNSKQPLNKDIKNIGKEQADIMKARYTNIQSLVKPKINKKLLEHYQLSLPDLIQSIQILTCQRKYKDLDSFLSRLKNVKIEVSKNLDDYNLCSVLTRSLLVLPKYIGLVHRVVWNICISQYYKNQSVFYWCSFVTANTNEATIKPYIQQRSTIFHIKSLTGRHIGKISNTGEDEVIFLPFTYFYIENIVKSNGIEEVWMVQIPAPLSFTKNVILWVDDNPLNNIQIVDKYTPKLQIVQVISTKLAQVWIRQFGWVLKLKGISYKTISDMVRNEKEATVYQAGINLLQTLHNNYGFTTPILIFCQDVVKAKENIIKRKITANRISSVTSQIEDVCRFIQNKV